jgi:hypothetical protein
MPSFRYTRGDERRFLDTSFEPNGDGYVFYRHHWARGIPVTAEEREEYLRPTLEGSRSGFYRRIAGRAPVTPRRPYRISLRIMLESFPPAFGWAFVAVGAMLLWRGTALADPGLSALCLVAGAMGASFGLLILAVRSLRR